jgi:hypothetical protein
MLRSATSEAGGWFFAVREARLPPLAGRRYVAWCARTPDLHNGPLEVDWAEDVHFEFADTASEAMSRLKAYVLS